MYTYMYVACMKNILYKHYFMFIFLNKWIKNIIFKTCNLDCDYRETSTDIDHEITRNCFL